MKKTVAILGASENPERYSYLAFQALKSHGFQPVPVSPTASTIDGTPVLGSLNEIGMPIDTLTVYVNPRVSNELKPDILKLNPKRVIFNPGTENQNLEAELSGAGIHVVRACTLVLLKTNQFDQA